MHKKICILLCAVIILSTPLASYKKAEASGLGGILSLAGVVGSGLTLGGVIATTVALGAALYGVSVVVDNWDDITDTVGSALSNATGEVKDWWNSLTGSAVHKDDVGLTFDEAVTDGKVINYYEYYKPYESDRTMDVPVSVLEKVMQTMEKQVQEPIVPTSSQVDEIVRQYKLHNATITNAETKYFNNMLPYAEYTYLVAYYGDDYHSFYNYSNIPYLYIYVGSSWLTYELRFEEDTNVLRLYNRNYTTDTNPKPTVELSTKVTANRGVHVKNELKNGIDTFISQGTELTNDKKNYILDKIFYYARYTSLPIEIRCSDELAQVFPELTSYKMNGYNVGTLVTKSTHTLDLNGKTSISINQNDVLINELNTSLNTGTITNTDKYIDSLIKANNESALVGNPVFEDTITFDNVDSDNSDGSVDVDESVGTNSIITTIKDFVSHPLSSLLELLQSFVTWIQDAWQDVISIPGQITDYLDTHSPLEIIKDIPVNIVTRLGEVIESIFVPNELALQEFVADAKATIEKQTGILTYPVVLVIRFCDFLLNIDKKDCIITIPEISFMDHKLLNKYEFNFTKFVNDTGVKEIYDIYLIVVDFIMVMWLVNLARIKIDNIMKGE